MKLVVITDTGEQVEVRCDACRHWNAAALSVDPGFAYCRKAWTGPPADDPGFGSRAPLVTSAGFGCVLFGRKIGATP